MLLVRLWARLGWLASVELSVVGNFVAICPLFRFLSLLQGREGLV